MLLLPVWSIYLITFQSLGHEFRPDLRLWVVFMGVSLMYAGAYLINQIHDYESDLINGKLGFLQRGMIKKSEMMAIYLSLSVIALIIGFWAGFKIGLIFTAVFLLGYFYSAPPLRLKDRPVGGLIANALGYGFLLPLSVPYYMENMAGQAIYIPIYFVLAIAAGYLLTVIPDKEGDQKTGKITPVLFLPVRTLILLAMMLVVLSAYFSDRGGFHYLTLISIISVFLLLGVILSVSEATVLLACKLPIFLISLLAGFYYPVFLVFLLVVLITTRIYYRRRFGIIYPRLS